MRNRALKLTGTPMHEAVVQAVLGGVPPEQLPRIPEAYHAQCVVVTWGGVWGGVLCGVVFCVGWCFVSGVGVVCGRRGMHM